MDGHDTHIKVDFLEACLERSIFCMILPAHTSDTFQPLDVQFLNTLKLYYTQQIEDLHLGAQDTVRVTKGMFYAWFQRAWNSTTEDSRCIRSAWQGSGLWPLNRDVMAPEYIERERRLTTPEAQSHELRTPLLIAHVNAMIGCYAEAKSRRHRTLRR